MEARKLLAPLKSELQAEFQTKDHGYWIRQDFWASPWSDYQLEKILRRLIKLIEQGYVTESAWPCWSKEHEITSALSIGIEEPEMKSQSTTSIHEYKPEELDELRKTMTELTMQIPAPTATWKAKHSPSTRISQPTADHPYTVLAFHSMYSEGPWYVSTRQSNLKRPLSKVTEHDAIEEERAAGPKKCLRTAIETQERLQNIITAGADTEGDLPQKRSAIPDGSICTYCGFMATARYNLIRHDPACIGRCQHCLENNLRCDSRSDLGKVCCSHCDKAGYFLRIPR